MRKTGLSKRLKHLVISGVDVPDITENLTYDMVFTDNLALFNSADMFEPVLDGEGTNRIISTQGTEFKMATGTAHLWIWDEGEKGVKRPTGFQAWFITNNTWTQTNLIIPDEFTLIQHFRWGTDAGFAMFTSNVAGEFFQLLGDQSNAQWRFVDDVGFTTDNPPPFALVDGVDYFCTIKRDAANLVSIYLNNTLWFTDTQVGDWNIQTVMKRTGPTEDLFIHNYRIYEGKELTLEEMETVQTFLTSKL